MAGERLDKHSKIHHELFDEDTNTVGSLGDIVEKHAGDAVFLAPPEKSVGGADSGLGDWEAEMTETDPAPNAGMDGSDVYSIGNEDAQPSVNQTGTVQGIARGFGTHMAQDLGSGGFQVELLPDVVTNLRPRAVRAGEELDDYDDDNNADTPVDLTLEEDDDDAAANDLLAAAAEPSDDLLAHASEPGVNAISGEREEPMPDRIPIKARHPHSTDDELDATREIS